LFLPFAAILAIPAALLWLTGTLHPFWGAQFPLDLLLLMAGLLLIAAGCYLLYVTVRLFATTGKGTLAPWDPPGRLVVQGPYRYVRNPMHSGVFAILSGEALLFGSIPVALWAAVFIAGNLFYIPRFEEPELEERFGEEYELYRQHVPRWIPRRTQWMPSDESNPAG